jgi:hypothetical protein
MPLAGRISVSRLVPGFLKKYVLICSSGGGALGTVLGSVVGAIGANVLEGKLISPQLPSSKIRKSPY